MRDMQEVFHHNFHVLEKIEPGEGKRKKMFVGETWTPDEDIWLIGAAIGLLCVKSDNFEIYLAVSRNPELEPRKFLVGLKRDWLFYQQRDVYTGSSGISDLMSYNFLPPGCGFLVRKGEPIYIKVGAVNLMINPGEYDAFCNLYYTKDGAQLLSEREEEK